MFDGEGLLDPLSLDPPVEGDRSFLFLELEFDLSRLKHIQMRVVISNLKFHLKDLLRILDITRKLKQMLLTLWYQLSLIFYYYSLSHFHGDSLCLFWNP